MAYAWFLLAGKNGKRVDTFLKKMKTHMTEDEIKEAEKINLLD